MLEILTQTEDKAMPKTGRKNNPNNIDLESFLRNSKENCKYDPSRDFLVELKIQTLNKTTIIAGFARRLKEGAKSSKTEKYLTAIKETVQCLDKDIKSRKNFLKNDYGILDTGCSQIKEYISFVENYIKKVSGLTGSQNQLDNFRGIMEYTSELEEKMNELYFKDNLQEEDERAKGLGVVETVLSGFDYAHNSGKKVKGSFSYEHELPLVMGDGSTRLIFWYLINKGLEEGKGELNVKSEQYKDARGLYVSTTISPTIEDVNKINSLNGASRYIQNVLDLSGGKLVSDTEESKTRLIIRVRGNGASSKN